MKKVLLKTTLLLSALIVGSLNVWGDDDPQWSYTVVNGDASKLNTTKKTFTVDASHVWEYDVTVAAGTPGVAVVNVGNNVYGIKFGSSGSNYFSPVILSTDAFSSVAITKVQLYLKHNGSKVGSLTVKQGDITIGTATTSSTSNWIEVPCSETNKGEGGTLTITYSVAQALSIGKIEVWYEDLGTTVSARNVSYSAEETSGEIGYSIINAGSGVPSVTASTSNDWISDISVNQSTKKVSFTMSTASSKRTGTITISYKEDGVEKASKNVSVTQIKYTQYEKATAATMVIGGSYVWYGIKGDGTKYVAKGLGSNTYLGAVQLTNDSYLSDDNLYLTDESGVQTFTFAPLDSYTEWNILLGSNKLGINDDKKLYANEGDQSWTMTGTGSALPTFSATYNSSDYTMYANLGSTRFNAYTTKGSNQDAILYHLATESNHTLTLDPNDGGSAATYHVKDGYSFVPYAPSRSGYTFLGWSTSSDATAPTIAAGDAYAMPAANTTLYAVWWNNSYALSMTGKWQSYCFPVDVEIPSNVKAYKGVIDGEVLELTEINDNIPAGAGVILKSKEATSYTFAKTTGISALADNDLVGTLKETPVTPSTVYALSTQKVSGVDTQGFFTYSGSSIPAYKAYLEIPANAPSAIRIVVEENNTTAVENIEANEKAVKFFENGILYIRRDGITYDVTGRIVK